MDFLFDNEALSTWLLQYGSFALFLLLITGIIALPIPEETLMVVAGALMSHGKLGISSTLIAAYMGSLCGISLSYLLGRTAGHYLINKYGSWIGVGDKQLRKVQSWFEHFGKWTLLIGYFIPGLRHFTGFTTGMTKMQFKPFALFAYTGAIIWVSTFLSLGYFCSDYCFYIFEKLQLGMDKILLPLLFIFIFYGIYSTYKKYSVA